ncbi:MAG: hypothetical protein IMW99_03855 [Firmicutes bacterium]|nr:hypothetical protein [Bacillota bacterium]
MRAEGLVWLQPAAGRAQLAVLERPRFPWARVSIWTLAQSLADCEPSREPQGVGGSAAAGDSQRLLQMLASRMRQSGRKGAQAGKMVPPRGLNGIGWWAVLGEDQVSIRQLQLPPIPAANLAGAVALEVERLTPWRAEDLHILWQAQFAKHSAGSKSGWDVRTVLVPRDRVRALLASFAAVEWPLRGVVVAAALPPGTARDSAPQSSGAAQVWALIPGQVSVAGAAQELSLEAVAQRALLNERLDGLARLPMGGLLQPDGWEQAGGFVGMAVSAPCESTTSGARAGVLEPDTMARRHGRASRRRWAPWKTAGLIALFVGGLALWLAGEQLNQKASRLQRQQLQATLASLQTRLAGQQQLQRELLAVQRQLNQFRALDQRFADVTPALAAVAADLPPDTWVQSLLVDGTRVEIRAVGPDAARAAEDLASSPVLRSVRLEGVVATAGATSAVAVASTPGAADGTGVIDMAGVDGPAAPAVPDQGGAAMGSGYASRPEPAQSQGRRTQPGTPNEQFTLTAQAVLTPVREPVKSRGSE